MKTFIIVAASISILLLLSTMICGFWIQSHPPVSPDSLAFHVKIGVAGVVFTMVSMGMFIAYLIKK